MATVSYQLIWYLSAQIKFFKVSTNAFKQATGTLKKGLEKARIKAQKKGCEEAWTDAENWQQRRSNCKSI